MIRSLVMLLSGNAFSALMLLARNLLVARLVPVADYGIAATFAITMAVIEMMSELGLKQLIVQARDGDDPRLQAALQGVQVLRGAFSALLLVLIAAPLAAFLHIPQAAWAYQMLALVPLLQGFLHLDIYRFERQMHFAPQMLALSLPALISVVLIWPLFAVFKDYRTMLYAVLAQAALTLALSHALAQSRYRIRLDPPTMRRALGFGAPLALNGLLLFISFQGEKLLVGRLLGLEQLAYLAMGFTLTLTPTLVVARAVQSFFLPQLSRTDLIQARFNALARATIEANMLNGLLQAGVILALGGPLVAWLLGPKYAPLLALLPWLALLHAVRVFKVGPAVVALARARTSNAMWANLCRVISLPLGVWLALQGFGLQAILQSALAGELCGLFVSLFLLKTRIRLDLRPLYMPLFTSLTFLAAAGAFAALAPETGGKMAALGLGGFYLAALLSLRGLWGTLIPKHPH